MKQNTYIITGGNSGLGYETAGRIAQKDKDNKIILGCRNEEKGKEAVLSIKERTGNSNICFMKLDLCSLESVRDFAGAILQQGIQIDGLDNNAGISGMHTGLTIDGIDVVFQSNHLGHFLLTKLLLPCLSENGRILNVSSDMHNPPYGPLIWKGADILAHPDVKLKSDSSRYFYSKLCNLYFTYELNRRLKMQNSFITVSAFNPGFMKDTNLAQGKMTDARAKEVKKTMPERYGDLFVSAQAVADILTEPQYIDREARYYDRSTRYVSSSDLSYNQENAKELWEYSERLIQKFIL